MSSYSWVDVRGSFMENSELERLKQEEIRRLKDSIVILKKEKDSYI